MILGKPAEVVSLVTPAFTGVDGQTSMLFNYASGAQAVLNCTAFAKSPTTATIVGTKARIEVDTMLLRAVHVHLDRSRRDCHPFRAATRGKRPALPGRRGGALSEGRTAGKPCHAAGRDRLHHGDHGRSSRLSKSILARQRLGAHDAQRLAPRGSHGQRRGPRPGASCRPQPLGGDAGREQLLDALVAPARSGVLLTRDELRRGAQVTVLGYRARGRRYSLAAMLDQDPTHTLSWLAGHARGGQSSTEPNPPCPEPIRGSGGREEPFRMARTLRQVQARAAASE